MFLGGRCRDVFLGLGNWQLETITAMACGENKVVSESANKCYHSQEDWQIDTRNPGGTPRSLSVNIRLAY